jgi:DNA-binding PadR family transcriptional regulator
MYELIILFLLVRVPLHGYLIAKILNSTLGPFARVSNGTLYPLLNRLEQAKLIAIVDEEGDQSPQERHARTFMITEEGRRRFHHLMMDTASNQNEYQRIFHCKVSYLYLLTAGECLHLLNHYINYCQTQILYYKAEAEDFAHRAEDFVQRAEGFVQRDDFRTHPDFIANTLDVMQHQARQWEFELQWAMEVRARESMRIEQQDHASIGEQTGE